MINLDYIKGKFKHTIYATEGGYTVGLFRVKEASSNLSEIENKTVTFTGYFTELNSEDNYIFYGNYLMHEKYGYQFKVNEYEKDTPTGKSAVVEFLASSFVKGCGEKTAEKIVNTLGEEAIKLIKEDKNNLYDVGLSEKTIDQIYSSIMKYYKYDELIVYLKSLGFTIKEITLLMNKFGESTKKIVQENVYSLVDYIEFNRLDKVFFKLYDETNDIRLRACVIESLKEISFETGDIYSYKDEIISYLFSHFNIDVDESFDDILSDLKSSKEIVIKKDKYYVESNYEDEEFIGEALYAIDSKKPTHIAKLDSIIKHIEYEYNITYDDEQKYAIKSALENNITIITGGPGTGKTTIINGILRAYKDAYNLTNDMMNHEVTLLAPTGRAAKRMTETTLFPASTIHRYLKWNRETNEFGVNEYNPIKQELLIVDETSMIDNNLFASLLRGIMHNTKLVLVGDSFQLPPVSPGNVLKDLIETDLFTHVKLDNIYRQSDNSFIPILAKEIKDVDIQSNLLEKRDDYSFITCNPDEIKGTIKSIIEMCIKKKMNEHNVQVLIPMYKTSNGIDNINVILQQLFNPPSEKKEEVEIGFTKFRVHDKVINLVNNIDLNIFNGDIGYIIDIDTSNSSSFMTIDFDSNIVTLKREDMGTIKLAYAMSIHKSQGSEFEHVIIPVTNEYKRMLYNKLIYTGVSRAKKTLIMLGDPQAFVYAVNNSYSKERKTTLKDKIIMLYNKRNSK